MFCKIGMSMSKEIIMRNWLQVASIIVFFLGKLISFSTCVCEFIFVLSWNSHLPWKWKFEKKKKQGKKPLNENGLQDQVCKNQNAQIKKEKKMRKKSLIKT
jgi:hypothetical protein